MPQTIRLSHLALAVLLIPAAPPLLSAPPPAFSAHCAGCHGSEARGSAKAPGLAMNPRVAQLSPAQLSSYIVGGNPGAGMPSFADLSASDLASLTRYLRGLNRETIVAPDIPAHKITWDPPQPGDWLTYNGSLSANRYSPLRQITAANVASLQLKWIFPIESFGLETTPLAASGVLYVTGPNQVFALDALTGSPLWRYGRPRTLGLAGDGRLGTNRGVAILDGRVFFVTDNAHLLALDRATGKLLWETPLAPPMTPASRFHYGGTSAPLIVNNTIICGVSGADEGIRGFLAAFNPDNGALLWRRWTVPAPGEPDAKSWGSPAPVTGGGSSWLTGAYDPASDTLFWATGNPFPDDNGDVRPGDNLYTNCVLALDPRTGALKWHYQFTPHDLNDRDATEPNVLVDAPWHGVPSHLLLHADRNGFFYVLNRDTGKLLLAKPFIRRVDWASGIGPDGKPVVTDPAGCPTDAANWDPTAYSPETHLYYVMALEECTGSPTGYPEQTGQRFLRALNIETGDIVWEVPQPGSPRSKTWTGILVTAGGLLFYAHPNGGFAAADPRTGKTLWEFPTNVRMKAPPMTFTAAGKQYVAVAAGPNILCFGL